MAQDIHTAYFVKKLDFLDFTSPVRIPQLLHMVWVGNSDPPDSFQIHINKWKELMPHWKIRIWRNEDITEEHFPANIVEKINNSIKGAQKCDIMRYYIIEKYGGVYMDADVIPHRSLDPIIYDLNGADVVLCHDISVTWEYIAIGFFAAVPHHPLLKYASELIVFSPINTRDINTQTGPHLFGLSVAYASQTNKNYCIIPSKYFYYNKNFDQRFGTHTYAHDW